MHGAILPVLWYNPDPSLMALSLAVFTPGLCVLKRCLCAADHFTACADMICSLSWAALSYRAVLCCTHELISSMTYTCLIRHPDSNLKG